MMRICDLRQSAGQATIELVAVVPLVLICGLMGMQGLAYGATYVYAGSAAQAAAMAELRDADPQQAARDALPGWAASRVSVRSDEGRVAVRLRPRSIIPGLGDRLIVRSRASVESSR